MKKSNKQKKIAELNEKNYEKSKFEDEQERRLQQEREDQEYRIMGHDDEEPATETPATSTETPAKPAETPAKPAETPAETPAKPAETPAETSG